MNNAATKSPPSRTIKPPCPAGYPDIAQGTGTDAGEKEPQSAHGARIAQTTLQSIGISTRDFPRANMGNLEYAAAVSIIFTKATNQAIIVGTEPRHVLSTSILCNSLLHDKRFEQLPMSKAAPGDIVIESGGNQAGGFAGIVVDHGRIVSNSSQGVRNNSSLVEIQRNQPATVIFRFMGVQRYPGYPLANAGYNPNEPRLPSGQPGGGQWTSGDAGRARNISGPAEMAPSTVALSGGNGWTGSGAGTKAQGVDDKNPKTAGQAAKETAQAFLSALASAIRSILFPSEPDREPSKPKNIFQLAKELEKAADNIDMTKPKGLGHAMAAGALIAAGDAVADGAAASKPKPEPSGLDAITDAKARVKASSDTYGSSDAQNMGKPRTEQSTQGSKSNLDNKSPQDRGRDSEGRVLNDTGHEKNTKTYSTSQGNTIPDFAAEKEVGDVKDTKTLSNTRQMRAQREVAQDQGKDHVVYTGNNTQVSSPMKQSETKIVRRNDLGPQQSN